MRRLRALPALVLAAVACGGAGARPAGGDQPQTLAELRVRVASEPGDDASRRRLAATLDERGLPGAAIDHWLILERRGELRGTARLRARARFVDRGRARLASGDPDALADFDRARHLGASIAPEEMAAAIRLEVAYLERVEHAPDPHRARDRLPDDLRRALALGPAKAPAERTGAVGLWLWSAGSRRAGYRWLASYIDRKGREARAVRAYAEALAWWKGANAVLGLELERLVVDAGALFCGFAPKKGPARCPDVVRVVGDPSADATELWRRAEGIPKTADPIEAAAWLVVALHEARRPFVFDGWLRLLSRRVDLAAVAKSTEIPAFAAPTLLRAAGAMERSRAALAQVRGALDTLSALELEIVRAELAAVSELSDQAFSTVSADAFTREFAEAVSGGRLVGQAELAGPLAYAHRLRVVGLQPVLDGYAVDPALAERRAEEFVSAQVLRTGRMLIVARLFRRLGDPARYRRWTERAVQESPRSVEALLHRGLSALGAAATDEAEGYITRAAALSGDPARLYGRAARIAEWSGRPVFALTMAKRALELAAPGRGRDVAEVAVRSAVQLGRPDQVARLRAVYPRDAIADSTDVESAMASGDDRQIEVAAYWSPYAAEPRVVMLGRHPDRTLVVRDLARIALEGPAREARIAAEALAKYFAERGKADVARAFEQVGRGL